MARNETNVSIYLGENKCWRRLIRYTTGKERTGRGTGGSKGDKVRKDVVCAGAGAGGGLRRLEIDKVKK